MEPVLIPKQQSYYESDKDRLELKKAIKNLKSYLVDVLNLTDADFDTYLELRNTKSSVTLEKSGPIRSWSDKNNVLKRFTRGKIALMSDEEVNDIVTLIEQEKLERVRKKNKEKLQAKLDKFVEPITDKYDYSHKSQNGFEVVYDDDDNSFEIEYSPINTILKKKKEYENDEEDDDEWRESVENVEEWRFVGYDKDDKYEHNDAYIKGLSEEKDESIIKELLNKKNTEYDMVITGYFKNYPRLRNLLSVKILSDGTITKPIFDLNITDFRKSEFDLDLILKISDKCIEWQIEILEIAEKVKSEINPKYWELVK